MKILIYNFVQFDDLEKRGGGVTVYLNNLVTTLLKRGEEVYFLSSGTCYDLLANRPRLEIKKENNLTRLIIFNSPFLAPASSSFYKPDIFTNNQELENIANNIFKIFPDIEVFHFHNLEGLTLNFMQTLKENYQKSKFLYSVHNYNLLCMQVNLWYAEQENCTDYEHGNKCLNCIEEKNNYRHNRNIKNSKQLYKKI